MKPTQILKWCFYFSLCLSKIAFAQTPVAQIKPTSTLNSLCRHLKKESLSHKSSSLEISSLSILDEKTWLVGGALQDRPMWSEPIVMRSDDEGQTWAPMKFPNVSGSSVLQMFFLADAKTGWVLVDNVVESPGHEDFLFSTMDAGKTWTQVASIPKEYYWGRTQEILFTDRLNGKIRRFYGLTLRGNPNDVDEVVNLKTTDGGVHWAVSSRRKATHKESAAYDSDASFHTQLFKRTQYRFSRRIHHDDFMTIMRRENEKDPWQNLIKIPLEDPCQK